MSADVIEMSGRILPSIYSNRRNQVFNENIRLSQSDDLIEERDDISSVRHSGSQFLEKKHENNLEIEVEEEVFTPEK